MEATILTSQSKRIVPGQPTALDKLHTLCRVLALKHGTIGLGWKMAHKYWAEVVEPAHWLAEPRYSCLVGHTTAAWPRPGDRAYDLCC